MAAVEASNRVIAATEAAAVVNLMASNVRKTIDFHVYVCLFFSFIHSVSIFGCSVNINAVSASSMGVVYVQAST